METVKGAQMVKAPPHRAADVILRGDICTDDQDQFSVSDSDT